MGEVLGCAAAVVFVALVVANAIKSLKSPTAVRAEFAHPVAANFFATPIIPCCFCRQSLHPMRSHGPMSAGSPAP
ncbi:hypothetical protein [Variovorax humicola]|uniref:hypothetical protein n=1 Tax=Variovorax humicola TaxID=1769758 RepID=UPI003BF4A4FE